MRKWEGRCPPCRLYGGGGAPPLRISSSSLRAARARTNMSMLDAMARIATTRKTSDVVVVAWRAIGKELSATLTAIVAVLPPAAIVMVPEPPESPAENEALFPFAAGVTLPMVVDHVYVTPVTSLTVGSKPAPAKDDPSPCWSV